MAKPKRNLPIRITPSEVRPSDAHVKAARMAMFRLMLRDALDG